MPRAKNLSAKACRWDLKLHNRPGVNSCKLYMQINPAHNCQICEGLELIENLSLLLAGLPHVARAYLIDDVDRTHNF
jgi:hypothetical protein